MALAEPLDYHVHQTTGRIHYNNAKDSRNSDFWGLLLCDENILQYYNWFLKKKGITIHIGSLWGSHVTWNRGEAPRVLKNWGRYEGCSISLKYTHKLYSGRTGHVWLNVHCPDLNDLRDSLGLKPLRPRAPHLTIGRLKRRL